MFEADIIVVGAGIAGASVARELAESASVILLEREAQVGYHSTGRSAAAFIPSYGWNNPALRLLTACSYTLLAAPPPDFQCPELLKRRGLLTLLPPDNAASFDEAYQRLQSEIPSLKRLTPEQARAHIPYLRDEYVRGAWFEPDVFDIDVDALHQGYLRDFRRRGGHLQTDAGVSAVRRHPGRWDVTSGARKFTAPILVNAAGAWADSLAAMAAVKTVGLEPRRRTAILVSPPEGADAASWPLAMCADSSFYFKPDANMLLVSPADEHPSQACDAQPEELDIAYAAHYAEAALEMQVTHVAHSWAGLRSFVADRSPVIGAAPDHPDFFWLAAQGGHGIQIAPAAARLAAALVRGDPVPDDLFAAGFDPAWVSPARSELDSGRRGHAEVSAKC